MKNFTNNFKQFTSRLSARWLIMALMMLVGTSSAWAVDYYLRGSFNGWLDGGMQDAYKFAGGSGTVSVDLNANTTYNFKIATSNWSEEYSNEGTMTRDNCTNWTTSKTGDCKITTDVQGQYKFTFSADKKISVQYPPLCSSCCGSDIFRVAGSSNLCGSNWNGNDDNNIMECSDDIFSKSYNITGNTSYTFKIVKNNSDWINTINSSASITNKIALKTTGSNNDVTLSENPSSNGKLTIYYDPNNGIYATFEKSCNTADFSVNTLSDLAVGCTTTASITGDNATVTWSSSPTSVASIDSKTGFITANAAGETTITATTTDANGFCSGTTKTTKLIVKNPSVSVKANKTTLCAGEELTLIATVTDAGTGNTYQWYKGDNSISGATSAKYTINSVSTDDAATYKVEVSGGILCQAKESAGVTVTVNPIPSAPTFTTNSAQVCSGVAFNLNEKFPRNSGEAGTLTWYKASDNSQVTNPASVTITESTSYYAKATNNNCTSDKSLNCTVNVDANPTLELASTPTVCPYEEIDLNSYVDPSTLGTVTWYSDTDRKNVITDGLVTPTERTTYYAKVINGTCNPVENEFTVDVYGIPDEMPAYTSTPATSCKGTPNSDGSIALKNTIGYITYTLDGKEGDSNVWTRLSVGTHKLAATINTCPSLTKEWNVEVEVEDITPAATVSITGDASFCEGGNTVLTSVVTATQGGVTAYQWYNGEEQELIQGATASTYTANAAGNYKVVVTVNNNDCVDTFEATKEVSVKNKPTTPAFNPNFTSICVGGSTTLASGYSWYTDLNASALANLTVSPQTETTYYAIKEENGCTSDAGTFTVTVNQLPTINIGEDVTAVKFEDVELTATGENIDKVEWTVNKGTITEDATDPTKAVLTYDQTGDVTVTAKAKSAAGCESAEVSKKVTFGEEKCETGNTKILFSKEYGDYYGFNIAGGIYLYSYNKDTKTEYTGAYPGKEITNTEKINGIDYYVYEFKKNESTDKLAIVIRATYDYGNKIGKTKDIYLNKPGATYTIKLTNGENATKQDYKETKKGSSNEYDVYIIDDNTTSTGGGLTITAPAVKIESITTTTGLGNINFTGRVVKKGCDDTNEYGFQYSTDRQNWTTVKVGENASAGTPFSDNTIKGLDGTYYIRAYITNDHSTQTSAEKEIRLQTSTDPISNVRIEFVASPGENNVPSAYCVGSTAYIKATYDGAKYTQFEWKSDQGITLTELGSIPDVFQFTVKGNDNIVLMLRNIYNKEGEFFSNYPPLVVNATPEPIAPTISLDKSTLCSNDDEGATISLANTVVGQTYSLFKEIENDDDTQIGNDIECTEQNKGSISFNLKGLGVAGRYYVIAKENVCNRTIGTTSVTLEVVNTTGLSISIEPNTAVVTPWEPVKLKITATEGYQYNVTGLDGMVYTVNGDTYTVKIPLPEGGTSLDTDGNVIFKGIDYEISATLITGGDNQCIDPAICTITLTPYLEPCTQNN